MSQPVKLTGWACLLAGLALSGCGERKGDLGAERQDSVTPAFSEPALAKAEGEAKAEVAELPETKPTEVAMQPAPAPEAAKAELKPVEPQPAVKEAQASEVAAKPVEEPRKKEPPAETVAVADAGKTGGPVAAPMAGPDDEKKDPPPPPAPETPEERAKRLLEEASRLAGTKIQARQTEAEKAFETGKRLYDDLQYEESLKYFEKAVEIDPAHRQAQDLLRKVRSVLGVHTDRIADTVRTLERDERVKIQETLVTLANAMDEARKYEEKGSQVPLELETAEKERVLADQLDHLRQGQSQYRRVKEIINWLPPNLDLPSERRVVEEALGRVRQKIAEKEDEISFLRRLDAQKRAEESRVRETELHKARVQKLLDQVRELYEKGQYTATEKLAMRVMQLDPLNSEAEGWKHKARAASHIQETADLHDADRNARKTTWESVEAAHIPYGDLLTYPPDWDRISRRTERAAIGRQRMEETWKSDIKKKLQRRVTFEFVDTPLDEAVNFLRSMTNVTMIVDPKVLQGGAPPINLRVTDMTLELALDWILRLVDLDYALKDSAIFISKKNALTEDVDLRIYDVSDLTQTVPDFPGPDFQLSTVGDDQGAGAAGANPFVAAPAAAVTTQTIADMIRNRVQPDSWDANAGTSIEERAGKLVVMQRPNIHALIDQLLSNFRAAQKLMVNIEARFLTIREAYMEDTGVEFQGLDPNVLRGDFGDIRNIGGTTGRLVQPRIPGGQDANPPNVPFPGITDGPNPLWQGTVSTVGAILNHTINFLSNDQDTISRGDTTNTIRQSGLSAQLTILNNAQVQAFIRALAARENTTVLTAPRLTVFNTQRAHMFVARQQSYIADYEISGDSYDPVIRQFLVGVVLDVKPTVSSDRRYVTMELRPTVTELVSFQTRQIDAFTVTQGAAVTLIIPLSFPVQFPELSIRRVRTSAAVPDGGILLLGGLQRNIKYHAENGVPFLSDLPVVGRLFRWNVVDNARSNLAILISPRIILFSEEESKL